MPDRLQQYLKYHAESSAALDIDPANDCLRYIRDRYELNVEQCYWLAFIYASCYSATTTFYIYNEFPDFETVDFGRLQRWWEANRDKLVFQTDRRWTRSRNQWVDCVRSYRDLVDLYGSQGGVYAVLKGANRWQTYDRAFDYFSKVFTFGRFTMFLYLEMVHTLAGVDLEPYTLDLANAESSRNGLCFVLGRDELMNHFTKAKLRKQDMDFLTGAFRHVVGQVSALEVAHKTVWSIETTLCAFKKHILEGKRWVGYYIERQMKEIQQMQAAHTGGVDWSVLWQFRRETYQPKYLHELKA